MVKDGASRGAKSQPRWRQAGVLILLCAVTALSGCASIDAAPQAPFDVEKYTGKHSPLSLSEGELKALIDATDTSERNQLLRELLSDIDVRYLDFSASVVSGKNRFDFTKNLLILSSSVASGLTESAGVKANYAALTTLLSGGGAQVDANFLFSQTSLALVSTMDEQRAIVLAEIRRSMSQSIEEYPGQTAFGDALRYFRAGTLPSAARELQKAAAGRAAAEEKVVRSISIPTDQQVAKAIDRNTAIFNFLQDANNTKVVRAALIELNVSGIDANTSDDDVRDAAVNYYRVNGPSGDGEGLVDELKKSGLVLN